MVTHDVSSRSGLGLVEAADEEDGEDEEKFDEGERHLDTGRLRWGLITERRAHQPRQVGLEVWEKISERPLGSFRVEKIKETASSSVPASKLPQPLVRQQSSRSPLLKKSHILYRFF